MKTPDQLPFRLAISLAFAVASLHAAAPVPTEVVPERIPGANPRNVVFIVSDDHRYYWEKNFPQTPTTFALRTPRFKYITSYGLCIDEIPHRRTRAS